MRRVNRIVEVAGLAAGWVIVAGVAAGCLLVVLWCGRVLFA